MRNNNSSASISSSLLTFSVENVPEVRVAVAAAGSLGCVPQRRQRELREHFLHKIEEAEMEAEE